MQLNKEPNQSKRFDFLENFIRNMNNYEDM